MRSLGLGIASCPGAILTDRIHREPELPDGAELAEYLAQVVFVHVLGELLDHDLASGLGSNVRGNDVLRRNGVLGSHYAHL